jgi:glycosyltransferase involved in cell wall biosynthesis
MKIAFIGAAHPLRGGLAGFNERLASELMTQGHEVTIYSFSLQYPSFLFPGKTQFTDEPAPKGLVIQSVINSINPLNWLKVGKSISRERPDLVIIKYWLPFMGPCFGTILRQIKRNKHSKVVCILDNVIPHESRPGDVAFTKYFLKPVDAFISMSQEVLRDLKKFTDKPVRLSPHPVFDNYGDPVARETAIQRLNLSADKKYILFFGFIRKYKGLDILLHAMNDTRIKELGIELLVAGEYYGDQEFYEQIIREHQLQGRVRLFTDFIPNEEVKYYFSASDLVVLPYRSATQSGITQIAYHFEKPMVVSNVGGLPEVVPNGRTGYVCQPEAGEVADAIIQFYQSGSVDRFREAIAEEKKKYSWERFASVIMESFHSVQ